MSTDSLPRPTPAAIVTFVVATLLLPCAICSSQGILWFLEQIGLSSGSVAFFIHSGKVGLLVQALLVTAIAGTLLALFRQTPFGPLYQSWFIAGLFTFPALALRFLGPNQDQLGALSQIALALLASLFIFIFNRRPARPSSPIRPEGAQGDGRPGTPFHDASGAIAGRPGINGREAPGRPARQLNLGSVFVALASVPLAAWPFFLYGALGSGPDAFLQVGAGLAFGLLAASLITTPADNYLLNSLGAGSLLMILGSAFGYDGEQLLLLAILPPFGFAITAVSSSRSAAAVGIGLLAAVSLVFVDPTEISLILLDVLPWVFRACLLIILLELGLGVGLWIIGRWQNRPKTAALPLTVSVLAWVGAFAVYFIFGQTGFHGDRLFVILNDQADVSNAYAIADRNERLTFVYKTLTAHADTTQADLRQTFDRLGIRYRPYYLVNALEVEGGTLLRLYLSTRPEIERVIDSPRLRPLPESEATAEATGFSPTSPLVENPGWNIKMIGADRVWNEFGVTGQNIVIGNSDSGVQGEHPALRDSYRGLAAGDDYNWYDPWAGSSTPNDLGGHGTHTTGTVVGSGGIGVAPGAQWIACVNLKRNLGNPALYLDCLQFMLAPFPQDGNPFTDGDPARAPHVLNNSWGCPPLEGCDPNALLPAVNALRAAGIFVVASAGNDGPACSTISAPLSLYDPVFSVGAVDSQGNLTEFSSRGPVVVDGSGRTKPDIAAPGADVVSSVPHNRYRANAGTSMAGPHVVGVVALLWSANPDLIGDIDSTEQILRDTARSYTGRGSQPGGCDDLPLPNNGVGYGIVDAYAAVKEALGK